MRRCYSLLLSDSCLAGGGLDAGFVGPRVWKGKKVAFS